MSVLEDNVIYDNVYGITYETAQKQMALLQQGIVLQGACGFESKQDAASWARDHCLDKLVYLNMGHKFMFVSHKGELLLPSVYEEYYGQILFCKTQVEDRIKRIPWTPTGFEYYNNAYIAAEASDGIHKPLYYRDYAVPTGFYNIERDCFNVAKPFPVFAKETGRDTAHIYTYIEHVAGECAMHLLAWLRAKMLHPTVKTQVVPIIVSRAQGSGKTTFAEVICKGLFGKDNVLVTDQYDSQARFNADYADALIVCQEEKEETDKRNPAGTLKSRATATTIRKEQKGIDPIYQESYTDFIMTTNKDVPIKFDGREDQRRFMIMEADEHFTRKESDLADEVFTKLYGFDADYNRIGLPFNEDKDLIAQFKHELFTRADIAAVKLRQFPKTAAYNRCFTLPRTTEATEIESILRALAPFIKASLEQMQVVTELNGNKITDVIQYAGAMQFVPAYKEHAKFIALCRPLVFYDCQTSKPYAHSTVERSIYDCGPWLIADYGIMLIPDMEPLLGGFTNVVGRYKTAPTAKFCLVSDMHKNPVTHLQTTVTTPVVPQERIGERFRVNKKFMSDPNGCFETVNEMKPGTTSLANKTQNVQYMDTLLFESDSVSKLHEQLEKEYAESWKNIHGEGSTVNAAQLYKQRLSVQEREAMRLFDEGIACRVVYSGAKSYHVLIRVADEPKTLEEYKWLHAYLCVSLSDRLSFDTSVADPARLTRSPIELPRVSSNYGLLVEGEQKCLAENYNHVYTLQWREIYEQWLNRPLQPWEQKKGKRLVPSKPEYVEAMNALLAGTFWTDSVWDGRRQLCFFAGYRLLRLLGYSHDDLWFDNILMNNIEDYAKPNEIYYWKSREQSAIIREIDEDIDNYLESLEDGSSSN